MSPGASGPETPKVSKKCLGQSDKSPESVFGVPRGLFGDLLGPRAGGPRRHFRDFFGISGPEGRETSVRGGLVPNSLGKSKNTV